MTCTEDDLNALTVAIKSLSRADADFAASLIMQSSRRFGLSDKQVYWVHKLIAKSKNEPIAPPVMTSAADLSAINALFAKAGGKRSSITFSTADQSANFRLSVAGPTSQAPGSINVVSAEGATWFGRISTSGKFERTRKPVSTDAVAVALEAFAADPAGQAAAYGRRTGECSFCSRTLTDTVSVAVGYGPICAAKWGLPHEMPELAEAVG